MDEYIIALARGGLCNRIKCLISAQRLAKRDSRKVLLFWEPDRDCGCCFSDLFENQITEINREEFLKLSQDKAYQICDTWRLLPLPQENVGRNFSRAYVSEEGNNIDFEYVRIPLNTRADILRYLKRLVPKKHITEKVDEFYKKFDDNTISVNIRSWHGEKRSVFFNVKNLYKVMNKEKTGNFFVVCDSPEILEQINKRYGGRALIYSRRTFPGDRKSPEGIQDALIELLLLARNKSLKASYLSTFSEMAWWLGGCQAGVEIIPITFRGRVSILNERIRMEIKKTILRFKNG